MNLAVVNLPRFSTVKEGERGRWHFSLSFASPFSLNILRKLLVIPFNSPKQCILTHIKFHANRRQPLITRYVGEKCSPILPADPAAVGFDLLALDLGQLLVAPRGKIDIPLPIIGDVDPLLVSKSDVNPLPFAAFKVSTPAHKETYAPARVGNLNKP